MTSGRQWLGRHNEKALQIELNANKFGVIVTYRCAAWSCYVSEEHTENYNKVPIRKLRRRRDTVPHQRGKSNNEQPVCVYFSPSIIAGLKPRKISQPSISISKGLSSH
jgi:hypothetical protein